jgi:TetR/AcrR family tetracycline transcriptional repressor
MPLRREEVLEGAIRLVDAKGLDALTMRGLAGALGVQAGAIYWHFADKQELCDAMADALFVGMLEPPVVGSWEEQVAELTRRMAACLTRLRDGARLSTMAMNPGPNVLAASEEMLRVVREAGFGKDMTLWATSVISYYVLGYVTDVQAMEAARSRGLKAALRAFERNLDRARYPRLTELTTGEGLEAMVSPRQLRARFEFGLQVILDGIKARRRQAGKGGQPRGARSGKSGRKRVSRK